MGVDVSLIVQYYLTEQILASRVYHKFKYRLEGNEVNDIDLNFLGLDQTLIDRLFRPFKGANQGHELYEQGNPSNIHQLKSVQESSLIYKANIWRGSGISHPTNSLLTPELVKAVSGQYFVVLRRHIKANFDLILIRFLKACINLESKKSKICFKYSIKKLRQHFIGCLRENIPLDPNEIKSALFGEFSEQWRAIFFRACDAAFQKARNYLINHRPQSITNLNIQQYFVIMYCLLRDIDDISELIGAQKTVCLVPAFKIGCQNMLINQSVFSHCGDQHLVQKDWVRDADGQVDDDDQMFVQAAADESHFDEAQVEEGELEDEEEQLERLIRLPWTIPYRIEARVRQLIRANFTDDIPQDREGLTFIGFDGNVRCGGSVVKMRLTGEDPLVQLDRMRLGINDLGLDVYAELDEWEALDGFHITNMGQRTPVRKTEVAVTLSQGRSRKTVDLERYIRYAKEYHWGILSRICSSGYTSFSYPPFIGRFTPAACPNLKRCRNPQIRNLTPFGRPTFVQSGPSGLICIYGSNSSACQFDASSQFCAFLTLNKYFGPDRVVAELTGQAIILGCQLYKFVTRYMNIDE
ncbi:hypothetical protein MP228_000075 [Amoeboaphelidium protococcarum]|nr:hypothetical protein MP228_000075 [Amoeboaphelidium protococcarum]